jgi:hypothetical protein
MDKLEYDAVLKNARWDFDDMRSPNLVGAIYDDTRGRFDDGTVVHTSTVMQQLDGRIFQTRNTKYLVHFAFEAPSA